MAPKHLNQITIEISREDLYEQVWTTPINQLAETFRISGSYLARVCEALNVPRPPVGYWQKKAVGKAAPRPELPMALPGEQLNWAKNKPLAIPARDRTHRKREGAVVPRARGGRHAMLSGVEEHFRKSRKVDDGDFLRPYKLLLPDIIASESTLIRALDLASAVYTALNRKGHRVLFAPPNQQMRRIDVEEREVPGKDRQYGRYSSGRIWSPQRPTITYIDSVPIGLALTEMTERVTMRYLNGKYVRDDSKATRSARSWELTHSWTTEKDIPCGRFRLIAYSPLYGVDWAQIWQDTKTHSIVTMIAKIVQTLEDSRDELQALMAAAIEEAARRQREWEEAQERYQREEDQRRVEQARAESQKQLSNIMDQWASAVSVERYFLEAEKRIEGLHGERRAQIMQRLSLARTMRDAIDPLDYLERWLSPEERYKSKYT
jgi:hypothetical protein